MSRPTAWLATFRWSLVITAVVMLAGHVCVLPAHGHVEAAPSHADAQHPYEADEAIQDASCEGLPSSPGAAPFVLASAPVVAAPISIGSQESRIDLGRRTLSLKSPPLFLLHASLLI